MQLIRYLLIFWIIFLSSCLMVRVAWAIDDEDSMEEENTVIKDNSAFGLIAPLVKGNTGFALDLYAQLREDKKNHNLFFSPYSISTALAMTYVGAKGNTAQQMSQVLHFPNSAELHPAFRHLQNDIEDAQKHSELRIANALWGQKDHSFLNYFKESVEKYYEAGLKEVHFETATETIRQEINTWVENQTNNKIKELVKPGIITALTRLVLVNAIYFKGKWMSPFKKSNTSDASFWVSDDESIDVPMMTQKQYFGYMENDSLQILELPYLGNSHGTDRFDLSYENNNISMIVLLPQQRDSLAEVESLLKEELDAWLSSLRWQKVQVFLPKFKINTGFELSDTLSSMGMPEAFTKKADFSGIDGTKLLSLTSVIHQAFVDVNEEGTEAAAATAVFAATRGMPPPTPIFRADHPFIFLIRHNSSGSILFMGRVVNPMGD